MRKTSILSYSVKVCTFVCIINIYPTYVNCFRLNTIRVIFKFKCLTIVKKSGNF